VALRSFENELTAADQITGGGGATAAAAGKAAAAGAGSDAAAAAGRFAAQLDRTAAEGRREGGFLAKGAAEFAGLVREQVRGWFRWSLGGRDGWEGW